MSLRKKKINNKPAYVLHRRVCSHPCGELDEQVGVVGLDFCLVGGFVADGCSATVAAVYDYVALLWVRLRLYRAKYPAAGVCPVPWIYIHVKRAKAKRTVIARGVAERQNLLAAVFTYKARVVF